MSADQPVLSRQARRLRTLHSSIGLVELACLGYLWFCALTRRRDRGLTTSITVLTGEGVALLAAKGCPLGIFQRRAGDDVPMFELWFGPRLAPFAIPTLTATAITGMAVVLARPPNAPVGGRSRTEMKDEASHCRSRTRHRSICGGCL